MGSTVMSCTTASGQSAIVCTASTVLTTPPIFELKMRTPWVRMNVTESDFAWLRKKREAEAEANFVNWFACNFDVMTNEQKQMAKDLYPQFYMRREQQLADMA